MRPPKIGQKLLYNDGVSQQRVPALVTYIWNDNKVNIGGFDHQGNPFFKHKVHLCKYDETCEVGQAERDI